MHAGKSIKLEIYEMESPAAAYGIYTFKSVKAAKRWRSAGKRSSKTTTSTSGKETCMVTVIGQDSEEETVQGVVALARAVDARIAKTGERPELAELLLREPLAFSHPKYIRGPLGVMNSYVFDTERYLPRPRGHDRHCQR